METTTVNRVKNIKLKDKELFTDSFNICWELLKNANYYLSNHRKDNFLSDLSCTHGQSMYRAMVAVMDNIIKSNFDIAPTITGSNENNDNMDDDSSDNDCNDDPLFDSNLHQQKVYEMTSRTDKISSKKNTITDDIIYPNKRFKPNQMDPLFVVCNDSQLIKNECLDESNEEIYNDTIETNSAQMLSSTCDDEFIHQSINTDSLKTEPIDSENSMSLEEQLDDDVETPNQSCQTNLYNSTKSTGIPCRLFASKKNKIRKIKDKNKDDEKDSLDDVDDEHDKDEREIKSIENITPEIKITNDIPFEQKRQIVLMARENPSWSLTKLSKHFNLKHMVQKSVIERWEKQITKGGTRRDMIGLLNQWVYEKCLEYESQNKKITNQQIKDWGAEAKKVLKLDSLKFIASDGWRFSFKEKYKITGNYVDLKIEPNPQKIDTLLRVYVSHNMKVKIIKLHDEHPDWSLEMLKQESGCDHIISMKQLRDWKSMIRNNFP